MLFVLCAKSSSNQQLLGRQLCTTLLPLKQQLENAEASMGSLMEAMQKQRMVRGLAGEG